MSFRVFRGPILLAALALSGRAFGAALPAEQVEFFEAKIRPVLAAECYECHNAKKTKGGLRLDYRDGWKKGGDTGDAIVPGKPKDSLLLTSIRHEDPDLKMPDKAPKLDDKVIADFEKWIAMGAPDPRDEPPAEAAGKPAWKDLLATRRTWWSLQPVVKPEPPTVPDATTTIDRFLRAKLADKQLTPAAPADARTFIRRLTFTLTGLPPTPEEVEAFVADSIGNRQSAIDNTTARLLRSPRFGEHWGRHWLDLMRYAETHGSEGDPEIREAWRYRDYVIRALNADVPLDQFIREHLAGDLLPHPRMNADGFNESTLGTANLRLVEHGFQPVDTRDDQVKAIDNQIDVATKAFQGLTVSCARCHDHKFDAVSERDYYALFGVFASVRPAQVTIDAPERQTKNRAALEALHGKIKTALADAWQAKAAQLGDLLLGEAKRAEKVRQVATQIADLEKRIADLEWSARRQVNAAASAAAAPAKAAPAPVAVWAFEGDAHDGLGRLDGELQGGAEILNGRLVLNGKGGFVSTKELPFSLTEKTLEAWVSPANLDQRGGGVIGLETTAKHGFDTIVFAEKDVRQWVAGSDFFKRSERLNAPVETAKPGEFVHVAVTYAANGAITFYRNGERYGTGYTKPALLEFPAQGARVLLGLRHKGAGNGFFAGEIEEARLYDRALSAEEVAASFRAGTPPFVAPEQITAALTPAQREQRRVWQEEATRLRAELQPQAVGGERWVAALKDAEKNPANPLHLWVKTSAVAREKFAEEWARLTADLRARSEEAEKFNAENYRTLWNLAGDDYAQWFRYGNGLPARPFAAGEFTLEAEGDRVIEGVLPAGVATHRLSDKHNALLTSPRFQIDSDSISVRASGAGGAMVRVIVDNYPLPSNPIFPKAVLDNEQTGWVRLDTAYRKGSWAYVEFGTRDDLTRPLPPGKSKTAPANTGRSHFAAAEIVAHNSSEPPRALPLATLAVIDGAEPRDAAGLASRFSEAAADAVRAWREGKLTEQQTALLDFLVRHGALPATVAELPQAATLIAEYRRLEADVPVLRRAPGVIETAGYDSPLLPRGDHLKPADPVPRGYLEVFGGEPFHTPLSGRLELAEKIASAQNPLTARVMANRVWHWMFGRGIVPSVDNFGRLGEKPTHPELLDYLAARLVEHGWSIKKLIAEIAATQAFQMSSTASPRATEVDPGNELLSHFRVQRLPAEAIRDSLIAVSGGLDDEQFGPPVAEGVLRRSIYLGVRRNALNPFLQTFDAPKPFTTLGRRDATNVPGQSLTMLNSPFVIAQADRWAKRVVRDGSETAAQRVRAMFAAAFSRPPTDDETTGAQAYLEALAVDRKLPADQLLASAPVWQDFAQSLFNLKEFVYLR